MSCKAGANLARTERRLAAKETTKPQSVEIRKLRLFLKGLAGRAIVGVRKKPAQSGNLLQLQDPKNPCPGQEVPE